MVPVHLLNVLHERIVSVNGIQTVVGCTHQNLFSKDLATIFTQSNRCYTHFPYFIVGNTLQTEGLRNNLVPEADTLKAFSL